MNSTGDIEVRCPSMPVIFLLFTPMLTYFLFAIGFLLLIKGADFLVEGSAAIAKRMHISSIVIGLTVVAFGTSMPELIVNIFASIQGNSEIAIGNILGSNIANIFLILGICAVIYPVKAQINTVLKEIPLSLLAIVVLGLMANDRLIDGTMISVVSRVDGMVLIAFFIIFMYYILSIAKSSGVADEAEDIKTHKPVTSIIYIIIGLIFLIFGGKWIVDGAVQIAKLFNMSQSLIGLTIVAVGTSLPELATSVVATYKKQSDIAIGNIVGSNIFNIFWILGVSAIIRPLPFAESSNLDIVMTALASIVLLLAVFIGKKHVIERWQGVFMIATYIAYVVVLIRIA